MYIEKYSYFTFYKEIFLHFGIYIWIINKTSHRNMGQTSVINLYMILINNTPHKWFISHHYFKLQ
ncbi:hypothetical protein LOK49_LG14G00518 [Camellia lanceoleosa]|uniref:Uncharacterized protein n=1 Tax=Camellia lanceoleosa TaxID=1840588 RepID=A0ACC0FA96_9ERIC|nr:hypothetical protein LOK49_LG14G00518 [Camellia lanceoleosa]